MTSNRRIVSSSLLELTIDTFDSTISDNHLVMINFFAPVRFLIGIITFYADCFFSLYLYTTC